eukprot:CAMPEP_0185514402 /NCGR_PEP_ID=MMETSP1366-20130426/59134_1 /TAXON_ID=38817 /ORGANISM="Gephyrocapsa oceanica, Strain RCC1303" /LENGTH=45 /DNA_ID= /DNA_START= /DNA_END= /DNA_ORIENTATION=
MVVGKAPDQRSSGKYSRAPPHAMAAGKLSAASTATGTPSGGAPAP